MNVLSWLLCLSVLILVLIEAVAFHEATICRQNAWLKATELKTRQLLHRPLESETALDPLCRTYVKRQGQKITWQRLPSPKKHPFSLILRGRI